MVRSCFFLFRCLFPVFVVLLQEIKAVCWIEGTSCHCIEEPTVQEDSLSNILAYCCQSDIFQVNINGSRISGSSVFYHKPCHNLIDFRIHSSSHTSLSQEGMSFNGLPNLEILYITGDSTLSVLPENAFSGLASSLRQLKLSKNALSSLTGSEFSGFANSNSRLDEVDLSGNQLETIQGGCFRSLKSIRILNLAGNSISELRSDMFNGLELLEELDLRRNPIKSIIGGAFQPLSKLRKLLIAGLQSSSSSLTTLTPGMIYGLQSLRHLQMSDLGFADISADAFTELRHLQELDLSGNKLTKVPRTAFKRMMLAQKGARFQRLSLSKNRLICLPDGSFSDFPQLKFLDLSGNLLTVVSDHAFSGMKHLREINLLENPLLVIIPNAFDAFLGVSENGVPDTVEILHQHRSMDESLPEKMVVRIPDDENIAGISKLRLRAVYGHRNEIYGTRIEQFIDLSCPRLPLPDHLPLKRSTIDAVVGTAKDTISNNGFLTNSKTSLIIIVVCAVLTLVVTSATILSCQTCRKRRRRRRRIEIAASESTLTGTSHLKAVKSTYPVLSKQNAFSYSSIEVGSNAFSEHLSGAGEKMSTSERLFSLGQQIEPPPYPHNLQTMEERLRLVAATPLTVPGLFNNYIEVRESPHLQSGQSSPSNLGSSPRFSSSTSSFRQQQQQQQQQPLQRIPPALHLLMTTSAIDHEKSCPLPPYSVSPLHESGIASDNASSSLMTALGVF